VNIDQCLLSVCFVPLEASAPKFFGFSEYLAALALMVVVWTTTDIRYRFRIATAPLPLHRLTFASIAFVGVLTLMTDLWRAGEWLVPVGKVMTPAVWQALMGAVFLITFLTWAWFAYLKPPIFGERNANRFGHFLYWTILDGSPTDMAIIGKELARSVPALIKHAPSQRGLGGILPDEEPPELTMVQGYANEILLLIADQRFCRTLVETSPGTILEVFQQINKTEKYGVSVAQFGRNIVTAAIGNPNSFMYHETEGYTSGLLGYLKPLSQAVFGNHRMAEVVNSLLDPDYKSIRKWTVVEWEAYNRAVLITLCSYVSEQFWNHSFILNRALSKIGDSASDLYKINGLDNASWDHDSVQRLRASVDFCVDAVKILNENSIPNQLRLRVRNDDPLYYHTIFDRIVDLMFEIIFLASSVRKTRDLCWTIQHNSVWGELFNQLGDQGSASKIVKFKLRRKIYDEIITATEWPNFKNVRVLAFCLNVMGLKIHQGNYGRDTRPLQKAVLEWTKRNFVALEEKSPQVFDECLPEGLTYDKEHCRLVATAEVNAFRRKPEHFYFNLEKPASSKPTSLKS
jgi:hypothetical protein